MLRDVKRLIPGSDSDVFCNHECVWYACLDDQGAW